MRNFIRLSLILLLTSCSSGYIVTTNLFNLAGFEPKSHVYTLPKTRIIVEVSGVQTDFTPGPYNRFAKKYLGIDGAKSVSDVRYSIEKIQVSSQSVPDKDYCYSVRDENYDGVDELIADYRESGLIFPEDILQVESLSKSPMEKLDQTVYSDLSIKRFYKLPDNPNATLSDPPLWEKQLTPKTIEEKAQEAAQFIFKIRKRRFKLLAGQYEVFPEGQALETSIRELNQLEKEYLSLFIGKETRSLIQQTYHAIPTNENTLQAFTLFRFSENTGFHDASGRTGEAVILQITDLETNSTMGQLGHDYSSQPNENILLVRIPDKANVKVLIGSHNVAESELTVFQFGALIPKYVPPVKRGLF